MLKPAGVLLGAFLVTGCAIDPIPPPSANGGGTPTTVFVGEDDGKVTASARRPEQTDNGRWRVAIAAERTADQTNPWVKRFEADGFRVTTETAEVDGTTWHRVILPGYRTLRDARDLIAYVQQQGVVGAWIPPRNAPTAAAATTTTSDASVTTEPAGTD